MKKFICDCTNPDFDLLGVKDKNEFSDLISEAEDIDYKEFMQYCNISPELALSIIRFSNDYSFFKNGDIYFFTHSCIEHFFK